MGDTDVLVVGAGLAGLSAGIHLQRQQREVVLLERRRVPGGLCGTALLDGREFAIGCNDFGQSLVRMVNEVGAEIAFAPSVSRVCFERSSIRFPPDLRTLVTLLPQARDLVRFGRAAWKNDGTARYLGQLVEATVKNPEAADLLNFFSVPIGVPPRECPLDVFAQDRQYGYGHAKPARPRGGPRALSEALARKFSEGGTIHYGVEVTEIARDEGAFVVRTSAGEFRAKHVISTLDPPAAASLPGKAGLELALLCLTVPASVRYPDEHSLTHCPPRVAEWFAALDDGVLPEDFSFNMVRSDVPAPDGARSVTIYFLCPRGLHRFDTSTRRTLEDYVLRHADRLVPGSASKASFQLLIDPAEYRSRFGMATQLCVANPVPGRTALGNHDETTGIYYAGRSVHPPGGHATAAFQSGKEVARSMGARA
jgi:phytoene dehydrogenase-like protein